MPPPLYSLLYSPIHYTPPIVAGVMDNIHMDMGIDSNVSSWIEMLVHARSD